MSKEPDFISSPSPIDTCFFCKFNSAFDLDEKTGYCSQFKTDVSWEEYCIKFEPCEYEGLKNETD